MKILVRGAWLGSGLLAVALFAGCPAKQEQGVSTDEGGTSVSGQPAEEAPADDEAAVKALRDDGYAEIERWQQHVENAAGPGPVGGRPEAVA